LKGKPIIEADAYYVVKYPNADQLGKNEEVKIQTSEHVLAALVGFGK